MSPYTHLTLKDRESILLGISTGKTLDTIAKEIGCSKSTVSREIARNGVWQSYSAGTAQDRYRRVRLANKPALETPESSSFLYKSCHL